MNKHTSSLSLFSIGLACATIFSTTHAANANESTGNQLDTKQIASVGRAPSKCTNQNDKSFSELFTIAQQLVKDKNYTKAKEVLKQLIEDKSLPGSDQNKVIDALLLQGQVYYAMRNFKESVATYQAALNSLETQQNPSQENSIRLHNGLDGLEGSLVAQKLYTEALPICKKQVQVAESTYGKVSSELGFALLNLSAVLQKLDRYEEAQPYTEQFIEIFRAQNLLKAAGQLKPSASTRPWPFSAWFDPARQPVAAIVCVHGLGLHSQSFAAFGKYMSKFGFLVVALDVRGFGAWNEDSGHDVIDYRSSFDDLRTTLKIMRRNNPNIPIMLLGESMGGAIALHMAAENQNLIDALVCSVPAGKRYAQKRTDVKVAIQAIFHPKSKINVGQDVVNRATTDSSLKTTWQNDPLARLELSPTELIKFDELMSGNIKMAQKIDRIPVLIVQGMRDRLVKPSGTFDIYTALGTINRDLMMFGTAEHLIFEQDQFTDEIIKPILVWINEQLDLKTAEVKASITHDSSKPTE